jgi:hypothetical protein
MSGLISPTVATPAGNTTFIVSYLENGPNQLMWSIDTDNGEALSSYYINLNADGITNTVEMRSINTLISNRRTQGIANFPKVLGVVSGDTSSTLGTFNDVQTTTSRTYTVGTNMNRIRMGNPDSSSALMIMYEVIVYNRKLNQTEVNQVVNYLKTKWNYANWAPTPTPTPSNTPTISLTPSVTSTNTQTPTNTPTVTRTPTNTPTNTQTPSVTPTQTRIPFSFASRNYAGDSTSATACANYTNSLTLYTLNAIPFPGDFVYTNSSLTTVYNGGNKWHAVRLDGTGTQRVWFIDNGGQIDLSEFCP